MHEVGILYETAKAVTKIAVENHIEQIKYIILEIGELTGIHPMFFDTYYPIVVEDYPALKGSELKIHTVPGEALCDDCKAMYNVMKNEGQCPKCQSRFKTILGGQQYMIKQIVY